MWQFKFRVMQSLYISHLGDTKSIYQGFLYKIYQKEIPDISCAMGGHVCTLQNMSQWDKVLHRTSRWHVLSHMCPFSQPPLMKRNVPILLQFSSLSGCTGSCQNYNFRCSQPVMKISSKWHLRFSADEITSCFQIRGISMRIKVAWPQKRNLTHLPSTHNVVLPDESTACPYQMKWWLRPPKQASRAWISIHNPRFLLLLPRSYDGVIKWKHFPRNWTFVRGIHRSPVNSPHKGQWRGALMFSLTCDWINDWVNNREAGDFRRYRAHYDVILM